MSDAIGKRMKHQYEDRFRFFVPRRTYTIVRLDGKAFHSLTKSMQRPYDHQFMDMMDRTAAEIGSIMQGFKFGYVQSDEASFLLTDFEKPDTAAWFDGNIQKIASVSASLMTAVFNRHIKYNELNLPLATFDARVFVIPDPVEVENYFIWRQQDCERNSVQMLAQHYYSQNELNGKKLSEQHEMIHRAGDNWAKHPERFKNGALIHRQGFSNAPVFTKTRSLRRLIPEQWPNEPAEFIPVREQ
jgi:tRNA(His) guanylyltransferase